MANVTKFILQSSEGWVKLEDKIAEEVENFTFSAGDFYTLQFVNFNCYFAEVDTIPNADSYTGFEVSGFYTYKVGSKPAYIRTIQDKVAINVGDNT